MIDALTWNCRDIVNKSTLNHIKIFIRTHHIRILGILEPMVGSSTINYFRKILGFFLSCLTITQDLALLDGGNIL
ncbi:hypothetical protein KSP39_PZI007573 [Platanthera zijinensis]|uniref:Uncharacterized protein n=1 Tax=Platanthera zijinensis TaxID=2320716 RepID=A0AAP0BMU0_9ASPA